MPRNEPRTRLGVGGASARGACPNVIDRQGNDECEELFFLGRATCLDGPRLHTIHLTTTIHPDHRQGNGLHRFLDVAVTARQPCEARAGFGSASISLCGGGASLTWLHKHGIRGEPRCQPSNQANVSSIESIPMAGGHRHGRGWRAGQGHHQVRLCLFRCVAVEHSPSLAPLGSMAQRDIELSSADRERVSINNGPLGHRSVVHKEIN